MLNNYNSAQLISVLLCASFSIYWKTIMYFYKKKKKTKILFDIYFKYIVISNHGVILQFIFQ